MPFFATISLLHDPLMLLVGLTVQNWIFRPPYCENIDFVLMLITFAAFFYLVSQMVTVIYGFDTL